MIPATRKPSQEDGGGDLAEISSYCGKCIKAALNNRVFKCRQRKLPAVNVTAGPGLSARVIKVFWPQISLVVQVHPKSSKTCAT